MRKRRTTLWDFNLATCKNSFHCFISCYKEVTCNCGVETECYALISSSRTVQLKKNERGHKKVGGKAKKISNKVLPVVSVRTYYRWHVYWVARTIYWLLKCFSLYFLYSTYFKHKHYPRSSSHSLEVINRRKRSK